MTDLRTEYLGLQLRSPIVASAGPLTGDVERIIQLEQCGAAEQDKVEEGFGEIAHGRGA